MKPEQWNSTKKKILLGIVAAWLAVLLFNIGGDTGKRVGMTSVPFAVFLLLVADYIVRESRSILARKRRRRGDRVLWGWIILMGLCAGAVLLLWVRAVIDVW